MTEQKKTTTKYVKLPCVQCSERLESSAISSNRDYDRMLNLSKHNRQGKFSFEMFAENSIINERKRDLCKEWIDLK